MAIAKACTPNAPFSHFIFQLTFFTLLTGLLILTTYNEAVEADPKIAGRNSFEGFMDSQSINVSILFTSLATSITLFWDYFFSRLVVTTKLPDYLPLKTTNKPPPLPRGIIKPPTDDGIQWSRSLLRLLFVVVLETEIGGSVWVVHSWPHLTPPGVFMWRRSP